MLLGDFQRLLDALHAAVVDLACHLFLTLHLRFHLYRTRRPGALQLIIKMTSGALAGESDVLTQQIIGIWRGLRRQLDAVIDAFSGSPGIN